MPKPPCNPLNLGAKRVGLSRGITGVIPGRDALVFFILLGIKEIGKIKICLFQKFIIQQIMFFGSLIFAKTQLIDFLVKELVKVKFYIMR